MAEQIEGRSSIPLPLDARELLHFALRSVSLRRGQMKSQAAWRAERLPGLALAARARAQRRPTRQDARAAA